MNTQQIINIIASIHNNLMEIKVNGEDIFRMSEVLNLCRNTVAILNQQQAAIDESTTEVSDAETLQQ